MVERRPKKEREICARRFCQQKRMRKFFDNFTILIKKLVWKLYFQMMHHDGDIFWPHCGFIEKKGEGRFSIARWHMIWTFISRLVRRIFSQNFFVLNFKASKQINFQIISSFFSFCSKFFSAGSIVLNILEFIMKLFYSKCFNLMKIQIHQLRMQAICIWHVGYQILVNAHQ